MLMCICTHTHTVLCYNIYLDQICVCTLSFSVITLLNVGHVVLQLAVCQSDM